MSLPEFYSPKQIPEAFRKDTFEYSRDAVDDVAIDIKPELNYAEKMIKFGELETSYYNLTNGDFTKSRSREEINLLAKDFRHNLEEFKKNYRITDSIRSSIEIFEKSILDGHINSLELYNESNKFTEPIAILYSDKISDFTDLNILSSNSSSDSFMFRGKYKDNPCYIKTFFHPNDNLEYEQKIYRYLSSRNDKIKPQYEDYFVKVYGVFKVLSFDFSDFLNRTNVKYTDNKTLWSTINPILSDKFKSSLYLYLIITEDIEGDTFQNFFIKNCNNEKLITNVLFDMLYGIYLMNDKLKLMHNDNRFENVLVKMNLTNVQTLYQIESKEYLKNKNYRLCFFDFDLGYLENEKNLHLTDGWLVQNKMSAKDIWTILNSIMHVVVSKIDISLPYIDNIINVIVNNSKTHEDMLVKIYEESLEGKFWNAYCKDNIQNPCVIPDEPFLYPLAVLKRYINNERIKNSLEIIDEDIYYKKYIKYKNKYLELCKKL